MEHELATQMHKPKRVITTNDGQIMVPVSWVEEIVALYDLTANQALEQPTHDEAHRFVAHMVTIGDAVNHVVKGLRPNA